MASRNELSRLRLFGDFIGPTLLQARRLAFMKVKMCRRPLFRLVEPTALSLECRDHCSPEPMKCSNKATS